MFRFFLGRQNLSLGLKGSSGETATVAARTRPGLEDSE